MKDEMMILKALGQRQSSPLIAFNEQEKEKSRKMNGVDAASG